MGFMNTTTIEYTHQNATLEAFLACDSVKGKRPTILIFHAWRGRDEFVIEKAQWLASLGYTGVALDMYGKGVLGSSVEENGKLMEPFVKDRKFLLSRMEAGRLAIEKHPSVDATQMGAIGFCFGGLCALDFARSGADLKGVVSFHGLLNPPGYPCQPKGKILVLHGYEDPMVPPEQLAAFQEEMTESGADWQVHAYGKTLHAFTNPAANDPSLGTIYNPTAEKRALQSMENFFKELFYQA
ncbi:MAG: dienelactone hydrolase family protein [Chlamydiia bacterium]|nr:dienelactone hydrolase family protein [Chlamydiia bacterium]